MSHQARPPPGVGHHHGGGGGFRPVIVDTNCFEITRVPTKNYYQYSVIKPDVPIIRKRHEIINKLQTVVAPSIFSPRALYDGKAIMYVSHELRLGAGGTGRITVSLRSDNSSNSGQPGVFEMQITRTMSEPIKATDLQSLKVRSPSGLTSKMVTSTNLLQLLVRQTANQSYPHNKTAYFTRNDYKSLSDGLELWRGFFQQVMSVRPTLNKLLVNVDITMSAVYQSGSLIDVAMAFLRIEDARGLFLSKNDVKFRRLEKFLTNVRIHTRTTGNKTKTIKGLVENAGQFTFTRDSNSPPMTVEQYFYQTHNIRIQLARAIGVRLTGANSASPPVVVPAELCRIIPGQLYRKKLPSHLTAEAVKFSAVRPAERLRAIRSNEESPVQGYESSEFVLESGMQISKSPLAISGKLLSPPLLLFGQDNTVNPDRGAWNVVGRQLMQAATLKYWTVVNFSTVLRSNEVERYVQGLMQCSQKLGMQVAPPRSIKSGSGHDVERVLTSAAREVRTDDRPELVLVILPEKAEEIRNRVKHWGDCLMGILTQCVREDKLKRFNDQYGNNVAIKINARLGGTNFRAQSHAFTALEQQPFMIIGVDVSHPGPGVLKPSIASLVFSVDKWATKYLAYTAVQHPREEIVVQLQEMVKAAIVVFGSKQPPPSRIIIYRDGVSDGEFEKVGHSEIPAIKAAIDSIWSEKGVKLPKPTLTFIVVSKRHHITFFPQSHSPANDGKGNCVPGFATDEGQLANLLAPDFYLQSHSAIQGTSRSGHYIVLLDENFNCDYAKIQTLSYDLCHVYAKATRSVSIPAPVYYADLVCARGAFHFGPGSELQMGGDDVSSTSSDTTFDLNAWANAFKPVDKSMERRMYFL